MSFTIKCAECKRKRQVKRKPDYPLALDGTYLKFCRRCLDTVYRLVERRKNHHAT